MTDRSHREGGFTLVEAMVSMTLALFILLGMASVYESNQSTYQQASDKVDVQQNARYALTEISRAVRMAGYFPENFNAGASLTDALRIGTNSSVAFYGDMDDNGTSEVQLFCLTNGELRRIATPAITAAAFTCVGGDTLAEGVTGLTFAYFDETGTPVPAGSGTIFALDSQVPGALPDMTTTTQRASVRRVSVSITTAADAPPGKMAATFQLGTVIEMRN